jgi:uncharacterized protein (DUF2141 family)
VAPPPPNSASQILVSAERATLAVELLDLRNAEGVVCVALFGSAQGFPGDPDQALRSGCFEIVEQPLVLTFPNLSHGFYAIAVHHDENEDGKLNCNGFGIPKEGFGFSGNPSIWKGAPSFERSAFEFSSSQTQVSITMKYLLR